MLDMLFTYIFNSKITHNEDAHDRSPCVSPEAQCGGCFIVTRFVEAGVKEIICQFFTLRETVATGSILK